MPPSDLVNLANQLACTLEDDSKRRATKILNLQLQQMESPKLSLLGSVIIVKKKKLAIGKRTATDEKGLADCSFLRAEGQTHPNDGTPRKHRDCFPSYHCIGRGKLLSRLGMNPLQ